MTLPPPPANFNLKFYPDESVELGPVEVYLNAVFAMYKLANKFQWTAVWPHPTSTFALAGRGVWIRVKKQRRALRTLHVVYALWYTVITMVSRSPFYQYSADIYLGQQLIGSLYIETIPMTASSNNSIEAIDYISTTNTTTSDSTSYSSGLGRTITLPDMNITYNFLAGRINSRDLYTAVLSGLADAAKEGMDTVCSELHTYSQSGNLIFWIDGEAQAGQPFTYRGATALLRAIVVDMTLEQRRFAPITFTVANGTNGLASGFISKWPLQGNGTASAAAAR